MAYLKPCPFCGGNHVRTEVNEFDKVFRIYCCSDDSCVAEMRMPFDDAGIGIGECFSFVEMQDIFNKMVDLWNRREG